MTRRDGGNGRAPRCRVLEEGWGQSGTGGMGLGDRRGQEGGKGPGKQDEGDRKGQDRDGGDRGDRREGKGPGEQDKGDERGQKGTGRAG